MSAEEEDDGRAAPDVMVVSFPEGGEIFSPAGSRNFLGSPLGFTVASNSSSPSSSSGIAYGSALLRLRANCSFSVVVLAFGAYDCSSILPRPTNLENGSSSLSSVVTGLLDSLLVFGTPSASSSVSVCGGICIVGLLPMLPGVCADGVRDNLLILSSLMVLFLLCPSSSQPPCPKLPLRISKGVGACARTLPVACHMPEGGLDSRKRREALRIRLLVVESRLRLGDSGEPSLVGTCARGGVLGASRLGKDSTSSLAMAAFEDIGEPCS